jgi:hypothetical protein
VLIGIRRVANHLSEGVQGENKMGAEEGMDRGKWQNTDQVMQEMNICQLEGNMGDAHEVASLWHVSTVGLMSCSCS